MLSSFVHSTPPYMRVAWTQVANSPLQPACAATLNLEGVAFLLAPATASAAPLLQDHRATFCDHPARSDAQTSRQRAEGCGAMVAAVPAGWQWDVRSLTDSGGWSAAGANVGSLCGGGGGFRSMSERLPTVAGS